MDTSPCPNSPVFRTGSEPTLSPALVRRFSSDARTGEALRGSDSQLCPKPPPKPCKVPFLKAPPSPSPWLNSEANYYELNPDFALGCDRGAKLPTQAHDSHETLLTAKQNGPSCPRNSGINYMILDGDDPARHWDALAAQTDEGQEDKTKFVPPLTETVSSFRPNDFESKLLPPENKPLETAMLKHAKELFTNHDARVIAQHMLSVDCKVSVLWLSASITFKEESLAIPRLAGAMLHHRGESQTVTQVWRFICRVGTTVRATFAQQETGKLHLEQREGRPTPERNLLKTSASDSFSSSYLLS